MATHTIIKINHDSLPRTGIEAEAADWARNIVKGLRLGKAERMPDGVTMMDSWNSQDEPAVLVTQQPRQSTVAASAMKIGSLLGNGSTLLAKRESRDDCIIIADLGDRPAEHFRTLADGPKPMRYATWRCTTSNNTWMGHYFDSLSEAVKDFESR